MHIPAKTVTRDIVVAGKGGQERFADLEAAVVRFRHEIGRALDWSRRGPVSDAHAIPLEHPKLPWPGMAFPGSLVFLDEIGQLIPVSVIYAVYAAAGLDWRTWSVHPRLAERHVFRAGPVPGTGRRRGSWRCYFRSPATFQELRRNEADRLEGLLDVRSMRRSVDLDIDFDDKDRSRQGRNWKHFRRTQWRI